MSIELTEQILGAINTGKTADIVYSHLKPLLDQVAAETVSQMKSEYRAGKLDQLSIQCKVAELVAIENIENKIKAQINKGTKALKNTQGKGD